MFQGVARVIRLGSRLLSLSARRWRRCKTRRRRRASTTRACAPTRRTRGSACSRSTRCRTSRRPSSSRTGRFSRCCSAAQLIVADSEYDTWSLAVILGLPSDCINNPTTKCTAPQYQAFQVYSLHSATSETVCASTGSTHGDCGRSQQAELDRQRLLGQRL